MSIRRLTTFSVFLCAFSLGLTGCQIHLAIAPPAGSAEHLASRLQTKNGIRSDDRPAWRLSESSTASAEETPLSSLAF